MASSSLALLLFIGLDLLGSRAAALIGDKVLWNGEFSLCTYICPSIPPSGPGLWAWLAV